MCRSGNANFPDGPGRIVTRRPDDFTDPDRIYHLRVTTETILKRYAVRDYSDFKIFNFNSCPKFYRKTRRKTRGKLSNKVPPGSGIVYGVNNKKTTFGCIILSGQ